MHNQILPPQIVEKISRALDDEIHSAGHYAEIAKDISDPNLRTLLYSMVGDEYGHARALGLILTLAGQHIPNQIKQIDEMSKSATLALSHNAKKNPISPVQPSIRKPVQQTSTVKGSPQAYTYGWY